MGLLRQRCRQPEVMDQPGLEPARHRHALDGLARINFLSGSAGTLYQPLVELQQRLGTPRLRILDVACGGGDVAVRLWWKAIDAGLDWRIAGCDISPVAVQHARARAMAAEEAWVHFFVHDALTAPLPAGYDAVICSLFLHHLDEEQAIAFLARLAAAGPKLILVDDLDRSWVGLALAHIATRLLTTSAVVHGDGPRSVRAAFTPSEALALAGQAGLAGGTIRRHWPCRWLFTWRRP